MLTNSRIFSLITEFGWSVVRWENGEEIQEQGHLGVQERRKYSNTFIPNNRDVSCSCQRA